MEFNVPKYPDNTSTLEPLACHFLEPCRSGLLALITYRQLCAEEKSRVLRKILSISTELWLDAEDEAIRSGDDFKKKTPLVQYALLLRALQHLHIPPLMDYAWNASRNPLVMEAIATEYPDSIRDSLTLAYQRLSRHTDLLPALESCLSGGALVFPDAGS